MNENIDIDREVDRILEAVDLGECKTTRYRMKKSKKMLKRASFLIVLAVGIGLVSAILMFGLYTGEQSGDLDLDGGVSNIYFDGAQLTTESFSIPMDLSAMLPGESFSFPHNTEAVLGNGAWDLSFCTDSVRGFLPEDPWFGFYFDITDGVDSIVNDVSYIGAGAGVFDMEFTYELDEFFASPGIPFPYTLDVILERHIEMPPVAVDDYFEVAYELADDCYVLANDWDLEGGDLDVTDVTLLTGSDVFISGVFPDEYIRIYAHSTPPGSYEIVYTIEDLEGLEDTATIFITIT